MSTETRPVLTIAVPTYNGSRTIRSMLDIMLPQVDQRIEVLFCDNCSTDETPQIIEDYRKRYPFIRVVRHDRNIGPDANFLSALRLARGKYVLLLSDDDILIEHALDNILNVLEENPELTLAYLHTVGFHNRYVSVDQCITPGRPVPENIVTRDKKEFMKYAGFYWGFMSSFVCAKDMFVQMPEPESYNGTYWLQSYIHIYCCHQPDALLGVIKGPCIGAGNYINLANFDTSLVDGVYYRKMLDYAVSKAGFDRKQLDALYIKRLSILGKRAVIKERAAGVKKTDIGRLIRCSLPYPSAWVSLFPFLLIPTPICRIVTKAYRSMKKARGELRENRPEPK